MSSLCDDTYMYDDEVGGAMGGATGVMGGAMGGAGVMGSAMGGVPISGPMGLHLQHWYDEPPYESDPEDFLIGKDPVREPYVNNFRVGIKEEDVISLRTAGDISVPRDVTKASHVYWSTVGAAGPGSNTSSSMSSSSSRHPHGHHTHVHAQQHTHWLEMEMEGGRRLCTPYGPQPVYDNVRLAAYTGSGPACIRPGNYPRRMAGPAVAGPISGPDPEYHNLMALRTCQGAPGLGGGRRGVGVGVGGRESMGGDYASDVQSVTSRLSAISVETNRSDPTDLRLSKYTTMMDAAVLKPQRLSPAYTPLRILLEDPEADDLCTSASIPLISLDKLPSRKVSWSLLRAGDKGSRSSVSGGSEDGQSNSHSSDYEDQDDIERTGSASLVGRMRGLRRDMQKKISRLKSPRGSTSSSPGHMAVGGGLPSTGGDEKGTPPHLSTSPVDALPSTGPLGQTASGSNRSSLSGGEEAETYTGPFIGRARALVDYQPSPYDRDAIKFKKGDVIDIIAKNPSGLWKGCVGGRVGHFKFILVEEEIEQQRAPRRSRVSSSRGTTRRGRSRTLEELLARLRLSHLVQVFVLNGYEDLEQFREVEAEDLDCLGITDPETRAKLLTAVALLHDADSDPEDIQSSHHAESGGAIHRGDHGRDSGCYTDHRSAPAPPPPAPSLGMGDENNLDTRQSTPSTDTSSGYHSRGAYNIPMGESGGGSSTLPRDDGEGLQDSSPPPPPPAPSGSVEPNSGAGSSAPSTPRSYRAQLATVLPASPRPSRYEQQQVDYEAKYVATRSVFERDMVSREVPVSVRSPRRTVNPSLAPSSSPTPSP
ncbi:uncharacterized protein LOC143034309 [Oratosquilla oratoria]|uniref:uncharacterized protein LOC143034309 n=1 Tax=Oratosquilla oratoria TaxID=337810 RepID=UPI003F76E11C